MKKVALLYVTLLWGAVSINAQDTGVARERKARFDLQIAQSFGLNDWNRVKFASDRLPRSSSSTDLRATVNLYIIGRTAGIFHDMGVSILPSSRNDFSDPAAQATLTTGIPFYTKEITFEDGYQSASAHFKMTFGVFGKISASDKFSVLPSFGVGFMTMSAPACDAVLKEQDANMQYIARYRWFGQDDYNYDNSTSLGYLAYRLRLACHISPKFDFLFGVEYTWFFTRTDFYETYTNYFNYNIVKTNHYKGNQLNMLGLSLGISF